MKQFNDVDEMMLFLAQRIKEVLDFEFGLEMGFALFVFGFGEDCHDSHYISNAQRKDMIKMIRETAERLENNDDMGPVVGSA